LSEVLKISFGYPGLWTAKCLVFTFAALIVLNLKLHDLLLNLFCQDGAFLQRALSFNRLMILWSVNLVGGFKMPLPSQCPKEFACIPEHFLDDAMDLLVLTSRIPKALESFVLVSILLIHFTMI